MDAGFLSVVEIGQYFMTKDTGEQVYAVACREYTLPRDDGSSQPRGWIQGSTKIGPVLEVTTSCLHGKYGVEIGIWSLTEDNTHSWIRISHGSNKFVMDSNNNDTEIPEDVPEEQALQLKVKDFACRSKAKAKPQRREPAAYSPSIIPMTERNWIDIEPGKHSLLAYEISMKVINLLRHSQTVQREDDGAVQFWRIKNFLQNQFPQIHYWSDDRWKVCSWTRSKKEISVLHWYFRNNYLFPSSSRTFKTQSYWSFIAGQCCDSELIFPTYLQYWMCVQSSFYHQQWIDVWRSEFKQETDSILFVYWSFGQNSQGSWYDRLECTTSCTIPA